MKKTLLFVLLLSSCYKEVKIDFPAQEILPVINSIFQPDSIISIQLNKTQLILENGPTKITDAIVTLYEDGQEMEVLEFDGSSFISGSVAEAGREYKVIVEISGFKTVIAEDKLVDFPNINSSFHEDSLYIGDEGDYFSQITFDLDNKSGDDYFELKMFLKNISAENNENSEETFIDFTKNILFFDPIFNDAVLQNEGLLGYFPEVLVFSDELMTEDIYKMRINYRPSNVYFYQDNPNSNIVLIIEIRKISKNYYQYKKTLLQHLETQFGDIWDGVGQPLPVFSNIQNGYGIFAGYSQITDTIQKQ